MYSFIGQYVISTEPLWSECLGFRKDFRAVQDFSEEGEDICALKRSDKVSLDNYRSKDSAS